MVDVNNERIQKYEEKLTSMMNVRDRNMLDRRISDIEKLLNMDFRNRKISEGELSILKEFLKGFEVAFQKEFEKEQKETDKKMQGNLHTFPENVEERQQKESNKKAQNSVCDFRQRLDARQKSANKEPHLDAIIMYKRKLGKRAPERNTKGMEL